MGKTFEALKRAEEQRRLRFQVISAGDNGFKKGKLAPLVSHEGNTLYEQKLNQMEQVVDEIGKMISDLITSMKKSMEDRK